MGEFSTSFFPHYRELHTAINSRCGELGEIERERQPAGVRFVHWKLQLTPRKTILPTESGRDATSCLLHQCMKRQLIICRQANRQTLRKEAKRILQLLVGSSVSIVADGHRRLTRDSREKDLPACKETILDGC